ncbi:hypothetical protein FRB90_004301 [Tulasnella sp. 427]|nr:hypothetical protein FRB90_004301 [Tulasnella sp. 427]
MAHQSDICPCMRRNNSSSNCSSASSSSSGTLSLPKDAGSIRTFPATEPEDYCRPTLSVQTQLEETQRLAVILDRDCWKSDKDSQKCDSWGCETLFSIWERKHHCRKCGGIYCQACSSKTMPLLDTSRMKFIHPPANIPMPLLAVSSPTGGLVPSRVCDDCYAYLNNQPIPSVTLIREAAATALPTRPSPLRTSTPSVDSVPSLSHSPSGSSSNASSQQLCYPAGTTFVKKPRHLRRSHTSASSRSKGPSPIVARRDSLNARSPSPALTAPQTRASPVPQVPVPMSLQPAQPVDYSSLGVLAEYPLKISSKGCKASGAAFWNPKLARRIESPIRYEAPDPRRPLYVQLKEQEDLYNTDEEEDDSVPAIPRRKLLTRDYFQVRPGDCTFGAPHEQREPEHVSTF